MIEPPSIVDLFNLERAADPKGYTPPDGLDEAIWDLEQKLASHKATWEVLVNIREAMKDDRATQ